MLNCAFGEELHELNNMERWEGSYAVVTGASAGIGAAICRELVRAGINVIGLARRLDAMKELSIKLSDEKGKLYPFRCDMTKEEDILQAFTWIENNLGGVSILVNNAGVLQKTTLLEGDTEMWREGLEVNVLGLCICTREAVKSMRKHEIDGHVFHINSIAGHKVVPLPIPVTNIYPATKHAVTALTESLRLEMNYHGLKVKVTSISPGIVYTDILENFMGLSEAIKAGPGLYPEDVANAVMYSLGTPPHVQVHEMIIKTVGEAI